MTNPFFSALSYLSTSFSFINSIEDKIIPNDNGILILTNSNFREALSNYNLLMVNFYLPYCSHCRAFAPEYLKVRKYLEAQGSRIKLGQVDAVAEKPLVVQHKIAGFPAIKLFKNGTSVSYSGARKANHIIQWLTENSYL